MDCWSSDTVLRCVEFSELDVRLSGGFKFGLDDNEEEPTIEKRANEVHAKVEREYVRARTLSMRRFLVSGRPHAGGD